MIEQIDTRYGPMFVPDTDNGQYWWLKNIGASPEDEYIEMVCKILDDRTPGIAIDVGANFGCWTLPLSRHADKVIAAEPQRCVFRVLNRTIEANDARNVISYQIALGEDERGMVDVPDIDMDKSTNFGGVEMNRSHSEHPDVPMYSVFSTTLDHLIGPSAHVSFIKADVEGYEKYVLLGAGKTIARCRPVLFVEALHPRTDTNALGNYIQSLGYSVEAHMDNFLGMPL